MAFMDLVNVSYSYPGQKKTILRDINLSIWNKGCIAVAGSNGCGKTTLSKLLIGILTPVTGFVNLNGQPLASLTLPQIGRRIGYVFQNPDRQFFCATVEEEISFGLQNLGLPADRVLQKVMAILDYFELTRYARTFPLALSAGEKRRLAIAAVLALEPELLVLDEPTAGLDPYRKRLLGDYLEKLITANRGVVLISHDQRFMDRYANRLIRLEEGQIVEQLGA
ncbi:MAG: Energy-coupling factor transporter ATP-binding protein EcfA1 [Pelotomaculum sp. PtaB.Bin104]|nr:MAG: Energy-coupling factor transporter ATP-binding protein EcfA1 [Pelotomaculum sp. PtaB.Bin104]